jgi:hypothetical protein
MTAPVASAPWTDECAADGALPVSATGCWSSDEQMVAIAFTHVHGQEPA